MRGASMKLDSSYSNKSTSIKAYFSLVRSMWETKWTTNNTFHPAFTKGANNSWSDCVLKGNTSVFGGNCTLRHLQCAQVFPENSAEQRRSSELAVSETERRREGETK